MEGWNPNIFLAQSVLVAESQWALFVSKHNLAFLNSDHETLLFTKIFKASEIAKRNFYYAHTKCAAISTDALAPRIFQILS